MTQDFQTDRAKAEGLGSAKHGTHHWMMQRVTAISNFFLMFWFLVSMYCFSHHGFTYENVVLWLQNPIVAIFALLFIISTFWHAMLGLQVVMEDYIHHEGFKMMKIIGMKLVFSACATTCIFSILKIALGA